MNNNIYTQEDTLTDEKNGIVNNTIIFSVVNELVILLTQDNELQKEQIESAQKKFDDLNHIKEKIKGKGGLDHDLNAILGQVLGNDNDFISHRNFIQANPEIKQEYKKKYINEIKTIELVDSDNNIGNIVSKLKLLDTDFGNTLDIKKLSNKIINKNGEISLLGIAYNLYTNATRFASKDSEVSISMSTRGSFIFIGSYNNSYQGFNSNNKKPSFLETEQ